MRRLRSRIEILLRGSVASVLGISVLFGLGCAPETNSAKVEMAKLQGTWQLVYQEMDGTKLPDEEAAKLLHGKMVFSDDKIRYTVEIQFFDFGLAYKLDPERQPKTIDLELTETGDRKGIGQKMLGIYRLEGDKLKICHNETNRPVDFQAEKGSHNVLIVLNRAVPQSQR